MAVKLFVPSESGMSRLPFIGLSPGLAYDSDHTLLDMRCRQRSEVFTPAQIQRTALTKPAPALQTWRHASAGSLRRRGAHMSFQAAILEHTENYRARARPARAATSQERGDGMANEQDGRATTGGNGARATERGGYAGLSGNQRSWEGTVAITNARLIDGTGADPLEGATLLLDGDRITAGGAGGPVGIPPGATGPDATGITVPPGLMDCPVHLAGQGGYDP